MARARNIKPSFFKNEHLSELSPECRLLFIGLWTLADRKGRLEDRPMRIKAELFPFDAVDVNQLLEELENSEGEFIKRYKVENLKIIQILKFDKHQHPHKNEVESELPEYSSNYSSDPENNGAAPERSGLLPITDSLLPHDESLLMKPDYGNPSSSSPKSFGEKLQQEEQQNFNKAIDPVYQKPKKEFATPVIPVGATSPSNEGLYTKGKTFFVIKEKETGQVTTEQEWIKKEIFLMARRQDFTETLDEALTQCPNQVKTYRRWMSHPMASRMAAYAIAILFSNCGGELTYAESIIRKGGGVNALKFNSFITACEASIQQGNYEVII